MAHEFQRGKPAVPHRHQAGRTHYGACSEKTGRPRPAFAVTILTRHRRAKRSAADKALKRDKPNIELQRKPARRQARYARPNLVMRLDRNFQDSQCANPQECPCAWVTRNRAGAPASYEPGRSGASHSSGMPLSLRSWLYPLAMSHSSGIPLPLQSKLVAPWASKPAAQLSAISSSSRAAP